MRCRSQPCATLRTVPTASHVNTVQAAVHKIGPEPVLGSQPLAALLCAASLRTCSCSMLAKSSRGLLCHLSPSTSKLLRSHAILLTSEAHQRDAVQTAIAP